MKKIIPLPLFFILVGVVLLRIPNLFEPYWYGDEGIYLTVGEGIKHGLVLYKEIFDHKPPFIYLLAAISGSLFWFKLILLLWQTITVILFWKFTAIFVSNSSINNKDNNKAIILSTIFFSLFTTLPILEGNIVNAELLMMLPIILGLSLVFKRQEHMISIFWGGIIFSFAILLKIPSIFEVGALISYWLMTSFGNKKAFISSLKKTFLLLIGILIPIFITIIYFYTKGALSEYLQAGLLQNLDYIKTWQTQPIKGNFHEGLIFRSEVVALVFMLIFTLKKYFDKTTLFVSIWFLLSIYASLLSGRPYPHYLIQTIAPLSLILITLVFAKEKYRFLTVPFLIIFSSAIVFYKFSHYQTLPYYQNFISFILKQQSWESYLVNFDQRTPRTYKLAKYLVEHTQSQERIFIWGTEPELYALSRRLPPVKFTTSFHIVDFSGQKETLESLYKTPPSYILRVLSEKRILDGLDKFIQSAYIYADTIDGVEIWKKMSPNLAKMKS